nr:DNA methyltransferase [Candidatus Sigynarchaeota archaeon]
MQEKHQTLDDFLEKHPDRQEIEASKIKRMLDLDDFEESEWTFKTADTKEFTHFIFHEYPARMIPQVARKLIKMYYPRYDSPSIKKPMLDPFAGSGTTCVEAMLRNIDSIAFDLNPLAHLVEQVKATPMDPPTLKRHFKAIMQHVNENRGKKILETIPPVAQTGFWFNEATIGSLLAIKYAINETFKGGTRHEGTILPAKNFFLACLGKTARDCSYQRKDENKTYRMERERMVEFDRNVDAIQCFKTIFGNFLRATEAFSGYYRTHQFTAKCTAVLGNSMVLEGVADNSIDLIVTSPPYGDSQTTVAYGQFSRFPLEWILPDTSGVKNIDEHLLGGVENETEFPDAPLLLVTCKNIMVAQAKQQQILIATFLDAIGQSELTDTKQEMKDLITFIDTHMPSIQDTTDFAGFIATKNAYYARLGNGRACAAKGNKWLDTRALGKHGRFKIYEDRLGYVISFFADFSKVLARLYQVLDYDRKCCLVVGNRTVKNVQIPTDEIIVDLGKSMGFEHVTTFYRDIPNKRMPLSNSPSNVPGEISPTMAKESIVVLNKPGRMK